MTTTPKSARKPAGGGITATAGTGDDAGTDAGTGVAVSDADVLDTAPDPQPGLRAYLEVKRAALLARREAARANPPTRPNRLRARAAAEARSGVRRIRIRHHQILSDSPLDFAGYDLGPASPEIQLGVLSSCLTHVFLIQAADLRVPLDSLEVEVDADLDPRAGKPGFEDTPIYPHNISYTVHVTSPAPPERIRELHEAVERNCPIYNLLVNPQQVSGRVVLTGSPREV